MAGFGGRLLRVCVLTRKSKHEVNSALACFRGHHIRRSRVRKKNECDKRTVPVCCGPYESYPPARNKFIHSFHSLSARIRPRPPASACVGPYTTPTLATFWGSAIQWIRPTERRRYLHCNNLLHLLGYVTTSQLAGLYRGDAGRCGVTGVRP
jgi:hypothetical protein